MNPAMTQAALVTSADILAPGDPGVLAWIAPALEHIDCLLPNDEQVLGFTGAATLEDGCRDAFSAGFLRGGKSTALVGLGFG